MSILEVMVGGALLLGVATGFMKLMEQQQVNTKAIDQKYELSALHNEIRNLLTNEDHCLASFGGTVVPDNSYNDNITDLNKNTGSIEVAYDKSSTYANNQIEIETLTFGKNKTDLTSSSHVQTQLVIGYKKRGKTLVPQVSKSLNIIAFLDGSNQVTRCYAVSGSSSGSGLWVETAASDGIYYNDQNNVGIGTDSPGRLLDIVGETGVRTSDISIREYGAGGGGNAAPNLEFRKGRGTPTAPLSVQAGDSVGGLEFMAYQTLGAHERVASIEAEVIANPVGADMPAKLIFRTHDGTNNSDAEISRMELNDKGTLTLHNNTEN
jgi:hypothetical protein